MQPVKKYKKNRSDISNFAIRIFLQLVGEAYDQKRNFEVFKPTATQWTDVVEFFDGQCCYCGEELTVENQTQDHLVPQNKKFLGLHAWGNVVCCCTRCNKRKQHREWPIFLSEVCAKKTFEQRSAKITAFILKYRYRPNLELAAIAENLYADVGAVVMTLIELRYKQANQVIEKLHLEK